MPVVAHPARRPRFELPYLARSGPFVVGLALLLALVLFATVGRLLWDTGLADPLSAMPNQSPAWERQRGVGQPGDNPWWRW